MASSFGIAEIKRLIQTGGLAGTDLYFDEESAEWLPLAKLLENIASDAKSKKDAVLCYCGSGLRFKDCHGA